MSIIQFPDSRENLVRRNTKWNWFNDLDSKISELIKQTPDKIEQLINQEYVSPNELLIINNNDLKALILDYIIFHVHKVKENIEWWLLMAIEYISDLLFKIFLINWEETRLIIEHPYYTHWMEKWYPKRAWDASIYSYVFKSFEKKPIKRENYIPFAMSAYLEYSHNHDFVRWIWYTMPLIWNITKENDFLKRWIVKDIK